MENIVNITYAQTGASTERDTLGMREMQRLVYAERSQQYLLVKAPPASGKSRALMYVALDKLVHQGIRKVIVSVPEKTIARSFSNTDLRSGGFFGNWAVDSKYNLCALDGSRTSEGSMQRVFTQFMEDSEARILLCTHSTFRNALPTVNDVLLNDVFIGIDEFHHTSASEASVLGSAVHRLMTQTSAHIMAMTGSYFRGDNVAVLRPEDEARFHSVTYNYYQQLSGYRYLKSLGIGYQFFQGKYITALPETLDTHRKTLIHIPSVQSYVSYASKYQQVEDILACIGHVESEDKEHFIYNVRTPDGRLLRVGDLVEDNVQQREALQAYLQRMNKRDSLDILIALGTAKEGFDWPWCETCLTVGIRSSLTEVVQIIGRCTRDCEGKTHAQFINLIPCPDATQENVSIAVNDMLKAITASLLMEQVLQPKWVFKPKRDEESGEVEDGQEGGHVIVVEGMTEPTERVREIVEKDLAELTASVLQSGILTASPHAEVINQVLIPKLLSEKYPELTGDEQEQLRQQLVAQTVLQGAVVEHEPDGNQFLRIAGKFINIDQLSINLIDSINPFQRAYEILSKSLDTDVLEAVERTIEMQRNDMTIEEAVVLFNTYLPKYRAEHGGALPKLTDSDPLARRLAKALEMLRREKQKRL